MLQLLRSNYRIQRRTDRWYMTIFYWALDSMMINSYLGYKSALEANIVPVSHFQFRCTLADLYMSAGIGDGEPQVKRRVTGASQLPSRRLVGRDHFPVPIGDSDAGGHASRSLHVVL